MERKNNHAIVSATTEATGTSQKALGIIIIVVCLIGLFTIIGAKLVISFQITNVF
jgi:hypothetical protein